MFIELATIVVGDYDRAITFFVDQLGFELAEDSPSLTNDGRPKRWVVVRPPGAETGILLAQADGDEQGAAVGNQTAGRVWFFLRVGDFDAAYQGLAAKGVRFVTAPRDEPYGRFAVFLDVAGNRWDLLGPRPSPVAQCRPLHPAIWDERRCRLPRSSSSSQVKSRIRPSHVLARSAVPRNPSWVVPAVSAVPGP